MLKLSDFWFLSFSHLKTNFSKKTKFVPGGNDDQFSKDGCAKFDYLLIRSTANVIK